MGRYRATWRNGKLFSEQENGELTYLDPEYSAPKRSETVAMPMIMRDIGEYVSTLDGERITSRSQHRDHMKRHDVVEVGNERIGAAPERQASTREIGEAIKRHVEEVAAMPQREYDTHVIQQAEEHAAVASLVTATTE